MKLKKNTGHSISSLFSLLLFSVFALFLMLMLLFSARVYQQTVKQTDSDSGLGTAITYLTTKFRQHDQADGIFSGSLDDIPALCFRDTLKGKDYITYIYLKDGNLTELFTVADSQASASAGTSISQLSDFQAENLDNGFYRISLKSATGISAHFSAAQHSRIFRYRYRCRQKGGIMKKSQHNSSTSLFLMEMILALLFLSLCSAACIQIFAAARKNRIQAEQWNQIQALTTSVGEALEGSNGSPKQLLALLPDGTQTDNSLIWYYDHSWQNCSRDEADYEMVFVLSTTSSEKSGELSFRNIPENTLLYQITLNFPDCGNGKEEIH